MLQEKTFSEYYNYIVKYNFSPLGLQVGLLTTLPVKELAKELLSESSSCQLSKLLYQSW